jgi:hypothetical protein
MSNPDPKPDRDHDHGRDHDRDHSNDNGQKAVAPAPAGGALTSLAALQAALNNVDTASVAGRSNKPLMLFKSRENSGTWWYGQKRIIPEEGSRWAVNPLTFRWGFICFEGNKVLGEHLVPISQPKPDVTKLPDKGAPWQEQWAVDMKCINGADDGIEVVLKMTTVGGSQAVVELIDSVRDRLDGGQHGGKVVPIVCLEKSSYPHSEHGRVWTPLLTIVDWMSLEGPAPAPKPVSPPPAQQPRRRRVA